MSRILPALLALLVSGALLDASDQVGNPPGYGVLLPAAPLQQRAEQVVYSPGNGVTSPTPISLAKASFPYGTQRKRIQGKVTVEFVVREDGTVDPWSVTVTHSVDPVYGLDNAAVKAVEQSRFKPGTKDGQPVAVRISADYAFAWK